MEITPNEIKDAYKKVISVSWLDGIMSIFGGGAFQLTNLNYNPVNYDELAEIIAIDQTEKMEYVYNENEKYTCADFSYSLMGAFHKYHSTAAMPVFVTWIIFGQYGHAVLSFYDDGEVFVIEPQNDDVITMEQAGEYYGGELTLKLLNG